MLKKLLKYDLENIFKFLSIFYLLALFFAILTRILFTIDNSFIINILAKICSGTTIAMIANILINAIMRNWVRFKNNLYGDESYLTHTLPIQKQTLYLSKILTAIISLLISTVIIILILFIAYYSKENITLLKNILLPMATIYDSTIIKIIFIISLLILLEFINIEQVGYTGIILGHRKNYGKLGYSVLFGFLTYIGVQFLVIIVIFSVGLLNQDIMTLFKTNEITNIDSLKSLMYIAAITYTITAIINSWLNIKLLSSGVNVD